MTAISSYSNQRILLLVLVASFTQQACYGCFNKIEPLRASTVWAQATGIQSYLQYEAPTPDDEGGDSMATIYVFPRGRDKSGQKTLTCVSSFPSNQALIQIRHEGPSNGNKSISYQCIHFEALDKRVIRLFRTQPKDSESEVNCATNLYTQDESVLVDLSDGPHQPCPLHGSFQTTLFSPGNDVTATDTSGCVANFRFNCNNNENVIVTFGSSCKPPIFKHYSNKVRYHSSTLLTCVGDWSWEEGNSDSDSVSKTMVLRTTDNGSQLSVWCLYYKMINQTGEMFDAYLTFDGSCDLPDPLLNMNNNDKSVFPKDTMYGHLANFVPARDTRCSNKFYLNQCRSRDVDCSKTNSCPSECGRCYDIPKSDKCRSMPPETLGEWSIVDSIDEFSVKVFADSFETSTHGKYSCRYSAESNMYVNPVVQYDGSDNYCMPQYACMQIFSLAPGVSTFYLRQTVFEDVSGQPSTCEKTNDLFKSHPISQGRMVTLLNVDKLKPTPCEFGPKGFFHTSYGQCLFNIDECSGQSCTALNVSYDNATCHNEAVPVLPLAPTHTCFASLKFQDGIRGLLTYSDVLEKHACWIYTSTRLFVTEPHMCNDESVSTVLMDKHSQEKYDPVKAFTVPLMTPKGSCSLIVPCCNINVMMCIVVSVVFMKRFL